MNKTTEWTSVIGFGLLYGVGLLFIAMIAGFALGDISGIIKFFLWYFVLGCMCAFALEAVSLDRPFPVRRVWTIHITIIVIALIGTISQIKGG